MAKNMACHFFRKPPKIIKSKLILKAFWINLIRKFIQFVMNLTVVDRLVIFDTLNLSIISAVSERDFASNLKQKCMPR